MTKKSIVPIWEWIVSLVITAVSGVVIWTNKSMDLLLKFGLSVKPELAFFTFSLLWFIGLSWLLTILLRYKGVKL